MLIVYCWLYIPKQVWLGPALAGTTLWFGLLRLVCAPDCVVRLRWRAACGLMIIDTWISSHGQVFLCTWQTQTPRLGAHFVTPARHKLRSRINKFIRHVHGPEHVTWCEAFSSRGQVSDIRGSSSKYGRHFFSRRFLWSNRIQIKNSRFIP